jgi:hypothetical protein
MEATASSKIRMSSRKPACPDFQPKHASSSSLNQMDIFHLALGACFIAAGSLIIGHFVLKWF